MHNIRFRLPICLTTNRFDTLMTTLPGSLNKSERGKAIGLNNVVLKGVKKGKAEFTSRLGVNTNGIDLNFSVTREHDAILLEITDANGQVRNRFRKAPISRSAESEMTELVYEADPSLRPTKKTKEVPQEA